MKTFILSHGLTVLVGTNAQDNFNVIDSSKPNDLWFHVSDRPSCHVTVSVPSEEINKKLKRYIIKQGAIYCKRFSRYSGEVIIEYTQIKNVTKTNIPGSIILSEFKTIII